MTDSSLTFDNLGLNSELLKAIKQVGYEQPSPIQSESIPPLIEGKDILGQAQTGTGKTAAFALPIIQQLDLKQKKTQALVLAPTRELAIQVAEACQKYSQFMPGFHVLPIYGGQGYEGQIRALKRGAHLVVGTPGRVMDHMRKGTLKLDGLKHLVLDEADEMLRMGFIDDVEWVLGQTPPGRQIALFSATMPREIAKVANTYLVDPVHVKIKVATTTAETITQRYWPVSGVHKLDALTRILEVESFNAMIIFVRTKTATVELAEKLEARGFSAAALNGDISQQVRERTVDKLKGGQIDILVATDVVARGLDVERISHVLNYDIPYDTESYVHRIGRTGRAGREGDAILFVAKRETRMLRAIEKATGKKIDPMKLPSTSEINQKRVDKFKESIKDTLAQGDFDIFAQIVTDLQQETAAEMHDIAAALAKLHQGSQPLFLQDKPTSSRNDFGNEGSQRNQPRPQKDRKKSKRGGDDVDMQSYRIEVGHNDKVTPKNIVGAIANEADIESRYIGQIKIADDHSIVDLPAGMPKEVFGALKNVWVCQKKLNISLARESASQGKPKGPNKGKPAHKPKKPKGPRKKPTDQA